MLTKKQIQLLSILKPFREYTRKQIKEISDINHQYKEKHSQYEQIIRKLLQERNHHT